MPPRTTKQQEPNLDGLETLASDLRPFVNTGRSTIDNLYAEVDSVLLEHDRGPTADEIKARDEGGGDGG